MNKNQIPRAYFIMLLTGHLLCAAVPGHAVQAANSSCLLDRYTALLTTCPKEDIESVLQAPPQTLVNQVAQRCQTTLTCESLAQNACLRSQFATLLKKMTVACQYKSHVRQALAEQNAKNPQQVPLSPRPQPRKSTQAGMPTDEQVPSQRDTGTVPPPDTAPAPPSTAGGGSPVVRFSPPSGNTQNSDDGEPDNNTGGPARIFY